MRLLLDENLPPLVGDALKAAGHDVLTASAACPGAPDEDVIALAVAEGRVLVTQDKDFGQELALVVLRAVAQRLEHTRSRLLDTERTGGRARW